MRLRHIEVFHAVYVRGSVTQAALMLDVSQPSVSKVLAHAELQLGFKLFKRVKGRLVATPEARTLHTEVSELYRGLGRIRRVAANLLGSGDGKIRIAATPALGVELMPTIVASYMRANPDVYFDLSTRHLDEIAGSLLESNIDIGLAFDPAPMPGIFMQPLSRCRFVLIAPKDHAIARRDSVGIGDIPGLPFIQLNNHGPLGQLLELHFEQAGINISSVACAETYQIARALVEQGVGVAIVDEFTARSDSNPGVAIIELAPRIEFSIAMLCLESVPLSHAASLFVEFMNRHFDDPAAPIASGYDILNN